METENIKKNRSEMRNIVPKGILANGEKINTYFYFCPLLNPIKMRVKTNRKGMEEI